MNKNRIIAVFGNEGAAEAFKMTAYHFGYDVRRTGSALEISREAYKTVLAKTYAPAAAIIATKMIDRTWERDEEE